MEQEIKSLDLILKVEGKKINALVNTDLSTFELIGIYNLLMNEEEAKKKISKLRLKINLKDKCLMKFQKSEKGDMPLFIIYKTLRDDLINKTIHNLKFKQWRI